jgi:hypothetical protein
MRPLDPQPQEAEPCSSGCCQNSARPTQRQVEDSLAGAETSPVEQCGSGYCQGTISPKEGQCKNDRFQTVKGEVEERSQSLGSR